MTFRSRTTIYVISISLFLFNCESKKTEVVQYIDVPTLHKSGEPNLLHSSDGHLYLSWIDTDSEGLSSLKFSKFENNAWSVPVLIASGSNWFVNWADFPEIRDFGNGNLVTHYLEKSAEDTYAYNVMLKISNSNGDQWNDAFSPHNDKTPTEHGFVSKVAFTETSFMAAWLDGRQYAYAEEDTTLVKQMSLRAAEIDTNGNIKTEYLIDERVCDCCQTDMTMTKEGPMVVYRDRSDDEIRDIYYSRFVDHSWSSPAVIYDDNWKIPGCPVNGPAISSKENTVAVVWFTLNNDRPFVKLAFSTDSGQSFNAPVSLGFINPLGRVDVELISPETALISWLDKVDGKTAIQLQKIGRNGDMGEVFTLSETSEERSSGFPKMVIGDDTAYFAWTEVGEQTQVRTAMVKLDNIK